MALIASQAIIEEGLTVSLTSPGAVTNTFTNTGKEFILIENSGEASVTCTVTTVVTSVDSPQYGDLTKANAVETVDGNSTSLMGTYSVASFNSEDSTVSFTLSSTTDIKIAILYIG
jgi:hypothetical protein